MKRWKYYAFSILSALLIGALGSLITSQGMAIYDQAIKPPLTPPDWVFPLVWTILYTFMGIGFARSLLQNHKVQPVASFIYTAQLLVNFSWSVLFFGTHTYGLALLALVLLCILIATMIYVFYTIDPVAGLLQIPYFIWVCFAGYLNTMIWLLNG